ncbi:MAG TPA: hypothetical protein VIZ18_08945 [Ktedonobacteraceae bacterium]
MLALELLWRWGFGIPALAIVCYEGAKVFARVSLKQAGVLNFSLLDPLAAAQIVSGGLALLLPPMLEIARWLAPLLAIAWAVASGLGRSLVLKRLDKAMSFAPITLVLLQLLRIVALAGAVIGWWFALHWAANSTLAHANPNLIGYLAWVICLTLGIFTLWALASWILAIAPMIAMLEGAGVLRSLTRSLRLGPLTGKLIEVNLSLSIVKLALIVVATFLSATPIIFSPSAGGNSLYIWWAGTSVLYFAASDFFQVARLAVFVELWRRYRC